MLVKLLQWHQQLFWSWGSISWISSCLNFCRSIHTENLSFSNVLLIVNASQIAAPFTSTLSLYGLCSLRLANVQEILVQTYAQSHTLQCCVALQWHKESLQPLSVHNCNLHSFINANAAAYMWSKIQLTCSFSIDGLSVKQAGMSNLTGDIWVPFCMAWVSNKTELNEEVNKPGKYKFFWYLLVQAIYHKEIYPHKTVFVNKCIKLHVVWINTPIFNERHDNLNSASHTLLASSCE